MNSQGLTGRKRSHAPLPPLDGAQGLHARKLPPFRHFTPPKTHFIAIRWLTRG
jgi:hypothetical protein